MTKKFGFDSRGYKKRSAKTASRRAEAVSSEDLTNAFKKATRAAADAAWSENLSVPCVIDGQVSEISASGRPKR